MTSIIVHPDDIDEYADENCIMPNTECRECSYALRHECYWNPYKECELCPHCDNTGIIKYGHSWVIGLPCACKEEDN